MPDPDFSWEPSQDRITVRTPGLHIVFVRASDRWTHHLALPGIDGSQGPGDTAAIVSAWETAPDHADPGRVVSPVYQELQRHEFAGDSARGLCILLTGHLFQHHFSAAVIIQRSSQHENVIELDFDIADRCRAAVDSLAATYLVGLGSGSLGDSGPERLRWEVGGLVGWLEVHTEPPQRLALAEAGRQACRVQALAPIDSRQFTHRLRYQWRWGSV